MPKTKISTHSQFTLPPEVVAEMKVGKDNDISIHDEGGVRTYTVNGKKIGSKKMKTIVNFILDKSGSMSSLRDSVISGFNEYINSLKNKSETEVLFSLTLFDSESVDKVYVNTPISEVRRLTRNSYVPNAATPLYDAVCETVNRVERQLEDEVNYASIVVMMTDGEENSSQEYTQKDLARLRARLEETGRWTFVYMGANQDSWQTAQQFGISRGNTLDWVSSIEGTTTAMRSLGDATMMFSASNAKGISNTSAFFIDGSKGN